MQRFAHKTSSKRSETNDLSAQTYYRRAPVLVYFIFFVFFSSVRTIFSFAVMSVSRSESVADANRTRFARITRNNRCVNANNRFNTKIRPSKILFSVSPLQLEIKQIYTGPRHLCSDNTPFGFPCDLHKQSQLTMKWKKNKKITATIYRIKASDHFLHGLRFPLADLNISQRRKPNGLS